MVGLLSGEPSRHGVHDVNHRIYEDKPQEGGDRWYFSREEIEENSPSRRDGIDLKKETYRRKSYCTFLQDLGMRLKVPQVTIATAIIFCHRFFQLQSHAKNDRRTIAAVCMFLAGKVEETPRPLKDIILVSYEIIHKKDPAAVQRIKQKEVYEQQKELILLGERVILGTLAFDLNVLHPYKPLVEAIKKFEVAQNAIAQVARNFVNDGLRTSLCLQFKPHHIAAGAIFLAAKFLKVKLPSDEVSNQLLELYEQNRVPPSQASEAEGSTGGNQRPSLKAPVNGEHIAGHSNSHGVVATSKAGTSKAALARPFLEPSHVDDHDGLPRTTQTRDNDYGYVEMESIPDHEGDDDIDDFQHHQREGLPDKGNLGEIQNKSRFRSDEHVDEDRDRSLGGFETRNTVELKDKYSSRTLAPKDGTVSQSPQDAIKKIDKEKVKAALERRKARGDINRKTDHMDELERELEDVELPGEFDKIKLENKRSWSKSTNKSEHENSHRPSGYGHADDFHTVEEGEVEPFDDDRGYQSPRLANRKRKAGSPLDKKVDGKLRIDYMCGSQTHHGLIIQARLFNMLQRMSN